MATITLKHGDVIEQLKHIADNSVDAIITDPPYNLSFMGKKWDNKGAPQQFQEWCSAWSAECLRVLRQGGYLLSFGGTRTFHRIASGIEDAGFVIKDCLSWNYGSGFPKSHNISKAIDKAAGIEPLAIVEAKGVGFMNKAEDGHTGGRAYKRSDGKMNETKNRIIMPESTTSESKQWSGYGTALKPAWEPIILAQKPFKGTIVNNVLAHGVGGMNIDACRIGNETIKISQGDGFGSSNTLYGVGVNPNKGSENKGRFPANTIFDEEAGQILDEQSGISKSSDAVRKNKREEEKLTMGGKIHAKGGSETYGFKDKGGASRFFYCPKTPKKERNCLGHVENKHPTVKPLKLMEHLIALVCPNAEAMGRQPVILDCFIGSGSTALAANRLNVDCIGIDADEESLKTARLRLMNDWRLEKGSNPRLKGYVPPIDMKHDLGHDITGCEIQDKVME